MKSGVVVLVRLCGNVFAVERDGETLRIRKIAVIPGRVRIDQRSALALLKPGQCAGDERMGE